MRIAPHLVLFALLFAGCSAEEELSPAARGSGEGLIGTYDWVSSTFSAGGAPETVTPETTAEQRALVVTEDSLVYFRGTRPERAVGYVSLGEVSLNGYTGLAIETAEAREGRVMRSTLATELSPGGTLTVVPLDPTCVEGCSDVYLRVDEE